MKKNFTLLFTLLIVTSSFSHQISNVKNLWLGNSNPDQLNFMPQGIEDMCLSKDDIVDANVTWKEVGGNFIEIINNGDVSHGEASSGWRAGGGSDFALNGVGGGNFSAPTAPTALTSSDVTATSFTLSWTASTDDVGVTGYDVYQGSTLIGSSATTSFNVIDLNAYTTYIMTVKAKDAAGNISAASTALSVTTAIVISSNLALSGIATGWTDLSTDVNNDNKVAYAGLNDGNTTVHVAYPDASAIGNWQGAGILWSTAQNNISSYKFYSGVCTKYNGFFSAGIKIQSSIDGITWTDISGWSCSPTYPYSTAASNKEYTFSGSTINNVMGIRVIGQIKRNDSWSINVREVQVWTEGTKIPVVSISINPTATLAINDVIQLTATVAPSNATNNDIGWNTSDASVAYVSSTGFVTAKSAGNATITVSTVDGSVTATCAITVTNIMASLIPGTLINSWFGNSNADMNTYMPQGIEGMFVSPDGSVYTNVTWEEGAHSFTDVKNGNVRHGATSLGFGSYGGSDATANSQYVYFTTAKGNEGGGLTGPDYPPLGKGWDGVQRCTKADIGIGAPFEGGKTTGGIPNSMLVIFEMAGTNQNNINSVYASETELFVSCNYDDKIRVYDANSMVYKTEWAVTDPRQLFMDKQGMLWVAIGPDATKIECYNTIGIKQAQEINLAAGSFVGDFCIDKDNRMLIGDVGQREQVLIYTNINSSPAMTATFGDQQGIFSGVPGKMAPLKFHQIRGIGTDDIGNIYIGNTQWYTGGQGIILESYTAGGSLNWSRYCTMFVDACGSNPESDATDVYGQVEHFNIDYSKPAGEEATLAAFTVNRYKYPQDPRLKSLAATAYMRTYSGKKFLITIPMYGGRPLTIYRYNAATDGEIAIPCVMWGVHSDNNKEFPNSPLGKWLWRDLNANGQMDNNEFTTTTFDAWSSNIDKNMTVWVANDDIYSVACTGLDANGVPMYSNSWNIVPKLAPFTTIRRLRYLPETDVMYLGGTTQLHPETNYWGNMGNVIRRYNNWSTGNRTSVYEIILPSDVTNGPCTQSFDVAGDYIFTAISIGRGSFIMGEINVYNTSNGTRVGKMIPPSNWAVGWNDMVECLNVTKRANGEYIAIQEDDGRNKNVMFRWCPTGNCVEGSVLPIALTSFTGTLTNNGNQLNWTTASEQNNSHFEIERSGDGNQFEKVYTLDGAGTTATQQFYKYLDKTSPFETSYYRLKQVDFNGRFVFSNVIVIKRMPNAKIKVYPNPFKDEFNIILAEDLKPGTQVFLYDLMGKTIPIRFNLNGRSINCKASSLPSGNYMLKIVTEQSVEIKVVIKK